jgi:hypothetical protein
MKEAPSVVVKPNSAVKRGSADFLEGDTDSDCSEDLETHDVVQEGGDLYLDINKIADSSCIDDSLSNMESLEDMEFDPLWILDIFDGPPCLTDESILF